jgi:MinD superfamily P-loop ATPase
MKIAIASGKGGTGKTTVAAALMSVWGSSVAAVDLDVEEPNLHLFLHPEITETIPACGSPPRG